MFLYVLICDRFEVYGYEEDVEPNKNYYGFKKCSEDYYYTEYEK